MNAIIQKQERNVGIELLRIVAMMMIVLWHIILYYWKINDIAPNNINLLVTQYTRLSVASCVNIYALISGFVMFNTKVRYEKIVYLYLQCLFYGVAILGIFIVFSNYDFSITKSTLGYFIPIAGKWWYVSAYFGMFALIPFVNHSIINLPLKQLSFYCIFVIIFFTVSDNIPSERNPFGLNSGYSTLWLLTCFIIGGVLKRLAIEKKEIRLKYLFLGLIGLQVVFFFVILAMSFQLQFCNNLYIRHLNYTYPLTLLHAMLLLCLFHRIKISNTIIKRCILFVAPLTLGVYLISEHPLIQNLLRTEKIYLEDVSLVYYFLHTIYILLLIYVSCSLIEFIRYKIFYYAKIDKIIKSICQKIGSSFYDFIYKAKQILIK